MKIGIIFNSQTGNTGSVAERLSERLKKKGLNVAIEEIKIKGDIKKNYKNFEIINVINISLYDIIILGSSVAAFSLSPVMAEFLKKVNSLTDKKVICFITQYFKYKWMGGDQAVNKLRKICLQKNAVLINGGIINWSSNKREEMISRTIDNIEEKINSITKK